MRRLATILLVALAGCSDVATYKPLVIDVRDQARLDSDVSDCRAVAMAWRKPLSISAIGSAGVQGASKNAGGATLNPLVPVLGVTGMAGAEALQELGFADEAQKRVFVNCLACRSGPERPYCVADPNLGATQ